MLQFKYQRFCYLPTFYSNVVEDALWVGDADGGRLIDGEPVGDVIAHLVLDAAVAGLGSNAGGVAGTRIENSWRHKTGNFEGLEPAAKRKCAGSNPDYILIMNEGTCRLPVHQLRSMLRKL